MDGYTGRAETHEHAVARRAWQARAGSGIGILPSDVAWLSRALEVSLGSQDRHSRAGAVIVAPNGCQVESANRIPDGVSTEHEERFGRDEKEHWLEHAELLAVFTCAASGVPTLGATLYSSRFPCAACARGIIAARICTVVAPDPELNHPRRGGQFRRAVRMFAEAGIETRLAGPPPPRWPGERPNGG